MARFRRERAPMPPRLLALFVGIGLGAVWGVVMWGVAALTGSDSGLQGLLYLAITTAMIGGGAAAIFGAATARRRGERVAPRWRPYRRS